MMHFCTYRTKHLKYYRYDSADWPYILKSCIVSIFHNELYGCDYSENVEAANDEIESIVEKCHTREHNDELQTETDEKHNRDACKFTVCC